MSSEPDRLVLESSCPDHTETIGRELAARLPDCVTVGLIGRLGAGKTAFVRGMASGLGIDPDEIASPTFVYLVDYIGSGNRRLHHADLYRLADTAEEHAPRVLESIGLYAAIEAEAVTAVEWWDHYRGRTPHRLVTVEFVGEKADDRSIFFELHGPGLDPATRWLATVGEPADAVAPSN